MKANTVLLVCLLFSLPCFLHGQSPSSFSYQAVIRTNSGTLVTNHDVGVRITVLQTTANGAMVYQEQHAAKSNANGLLTLQIGSGTNKVGNLAAVDWLAGPYFLKSETDPDGGTNYSIVSSQQLLSVPYAMHARTAEKIAEGKRLYLGQDTLGGLIFYLYEGQDGKAHGLVVNKEEIANTLWQTTASLVETGTSWNGKLNTSRMTNSPAATYVRSLQDGGFTDWYLPSADELNLLYQCRFIINQVLTNTSYPFIASTGEYWSSNEYFAGNALVLSMLTGTFSTASKTTGKTARGIRSF